MPIVHDPGTDAFVLRCVSKHPDQEALRPLPGRYRLVPFDGPSGEICHAIVTGYYYCHVCGYVESYLPREALGQMGRVR